MEDNKRPGKGSETFTITLSESWQTQCNHQDDRFNINYKLHLEALILLYKSKLEQFLIDNNYKIQTTEIEHCDPEEGFKEVKKIVDHYMEHFNISVQRYGDVKNEEG